MRIFLCFLLLAAVSFTMADIDPKCHGGRPCVKCDCMGDYGAMLPGG